MRSPCVRPKPTVPAFPRSAHSLIGLSTVEWQVVRQFPQSWRLDLPQSAALLSLQSQEVNQPEHVDAQQRVEQIHFQLMLLQQSWLCALPQPTCRMPTTWPIALWSCPYVSIYRTLLSQRHLISHKRIERLLQRQ